MVDYLRVGVISNTHGIRGEVKVFPTTDDAERYETLKEVINTFYKCRTSWINSGKSQFAIKIGTPKQTG